jgi:hypothetical protein
MTENSAEDQLKRFRKEMGDALGVPFHFCRQNLFHVSSQWDVYVVFFGHPDRVDLLNKVNGNLAFLFDDMILRSVVLGIFRLLDPEKSLGKPNLSLRLFPNLCDPSLVRQLNTKLADLDKAMLPMTKIRHKVLAHNDYDHATQRAKPLEYVSRQDITRALAMICEYLNIIELHYSKNTTFLAPIGDQGARALLIRMHYGELWKQHCSKVPALKNVVDQDFLGWPKSIDEGTDDFERYMKLPS